MLRLSESCWSAEVRVASWTNGSLLMREELSLKPITNVFGADNRRRLLDCYFASIPEVYPGDAWRHIYRLLLWIDRTTGLAHCYESDKSQPGRPWYERSVRFHVWLAGELDCIPSTLAPRIDWLFRQAVKDLAIDLSEQQQARAERQKRDLGSFDIPEPGRDAELEDVILNALDPWIRQTPPEAEMRRLIGRIYQHTRLENKRKNLVGEGFEDVLFTLVSRMVESEVSEVMVRSPLSKIPGFFGAPGREKPRLVDLALLHGANSRRCLVTAKWSVRADREEQFVSDFTSYARLERLGEPFDYVLVTNEFDPARLIRAAERQREGKELFTEVVHVNTGALRAAYEGESRASWRKAMAYMDCGRIKSLGAWLGQFQRETIHVNLA